MSRLIIAQLARCLVLLIVLVLISCLGAAAAVVKVSELAIDCLECHDDIWDNEASTNLMHAPFQEKKCILCHSENSRLWVDDESWVRNSPSTSHWFEFNREHPTTIVLQASSRGGVRLIREIPLPPLDELSELSDVYEQDPPEIYDVKVLEVKQGIFLTASIYWQTDRQTGSMITFGVEKLQQVTPIGSRKTEHLETLVDLKHDQTYQFRITAEDDFGNRTESDVFKFSTAATFSNPTREAVSENCCSEKRALSLKSNIFRRGDQYLTNITGTQPFKIVLSLKSNLNIATEAVNWDEDEEHIILAEEKVNTFLICKRCHSYSDHHPVNVYPKKGMKVMADHPTMSDGRISCVSCHDPHASNLEFLLIKDKQQALCVGCHNILKYNRGT